MTREAEEKDQAVVALAPPTEAERREQLSQLTDYQEPQTTTANAALAPHISEVTGDVNLKPSEGGILERLQKKLGQKY
jgi:hypothetical protein